MTPTDIEVVAEARSWVGVPFLHQGRSRRGIDCVGLPVVIAMSLGLVPRTFDTGAYGRLPTGELTDRLQDACIKTDKPKSGTIVVIAWTKTAAHTAICTGPTLIHAYQSVGRVVEHGYRGRWLRMTHSMWMLPGVRYE
jgi:cell wall-associated NlpC family hydrolase